MNSPRRLLADRCTADGSRSQDPPNGRRDGFEQGLAAGWLDPADEEQAIEERVEGWGVSLRPRDGWEEWLLRMLAIESIRLERILQEERVLGEHLVRRAASMWDMDRDLAAIELGARLARDPERVAARLRGTAHGCDWIIGRWCGLGALLERVGAWDECRRSIVMDLMGIPADVRDADPLGLEGASVEELKGLVEEQIAALRALKAERLDALDVDLRKAAEGGIFLRDVPKPLAQVRRSRSECQRRIAWIRGELDRFRPTCPAPDAAPHAGPVDPSPRPRPVAEPAPPPPPAPPPGPKASGRTAEEDRRLESLMARMGLGLPDDADLFGAADVPPVLPVTAARTHAASLAPSKRQDRRRAPRRRPR